MKSLSYLQIYLPTQNKCLSPSFEVLRDLSIKITTQKLISCLYRIRYLKILYLLLNKAIYSLNMETVMQGSIHSSTGAHTFVQKGMDEWIDPVWTCILVARGQLRVFLSVTYHPIPLGLDHSVRPQLIKRLCQLTTEPQDPSVFACQLQD